MKQGSWVQGLRWLVASDAFRGTILSLIVVNAFALGLEATPDAAARYAPLLDWVFLTCQVVFVAELLLRWLAADRWFFKDSWNRFDFALVALSLLPAIGGLALLARVFRVLRILRVVTVGQVLWGSVLRGDDGLRAGLLALLLSLLSGYVFALLGFHLFGESSQEWGSLWLAISSLARALTPSGIAAAWQTGGGLLLFLGLFYLSLASIAVNLAISLMRRSRGAAFLAIKRPSLLLIGALLTLPLVYFLVERIDFMRSSRKAVATVESVQARHYSCRRGVDHLCTEFAATLTFNVDGKTHWFLVDAGWVRFRTEVLRRARYQVKELLYVVYDVRKPDHAYVDTLWNVWGTPLLILLAQIAAFIGCLRERYLEHPWWRY